MAASLLPTLKLKRAVCCAALKIEKPIFLNVIQYAFASILALDSGLFLYSIVLHIFNGFGIPY
jgi:hypothetical protein